MHRRYNPEGISQYNIVPGLLGVILQMTMVMMTSMALTRETERGTMENLLAMPASPLEIMLGKILPYLGGRRACRWRWCWRRAKLLFAVPFVGSLPLLLAAILVFVLALVLLGYTISTVARTQMQAMQLTFFFFLPSILLSGFMFPYRGMPGWAQALGEILPLTHFLRIIRAVMLKGADLPAIAGEIGCAGGLRRRCSPAWRCCGSGGRWIDGPCLSPIQRLAVVEEVRPRIGGAQPLLQCLVADREIGRPHAVGDHLPGHRHRHRGALLGA